MLDSAFALLRVQGHFLKCAFMVQYFIASFMALNGLTLRDIEVSCCVFLKFVLNFEVGFGSCDSGGLG